jgi:hypothetical protein
MSKDLGGELPDDVLRGLNGDDLEAVADRVIVVCSVDDRGFPHAALLSYFEVLALDSRTIRLAAYAQSGTTRNARREGRLTLLFVDAGFVYYIKGLVEEIDAPMRVTPHNARLTLRVTAVLADAPDPTFEPGAYIATGIRYVNPGRAQELERARLVLAELRESS